MAIKSKKWKNRIVFLVFFIGISMLMAGIGRFAYESYSVGVDEVCAELKEKDYQESKEFRNTVLNRFYTFLDVATGNYHGDSGYSGSAVNEENIDDYLSPGGNFFDRLFGTNNGISEYVVGTAATSDIYENPDAAETAGTDENSSTTYEEVSDTEHIYMASDDSTGYQEKSEEEYFADVNKDHNFFYEICYDGKIMYSNMPDDVTDATSSDGASSDGKNNTAALLKNLPEGYNYAFHFDGKKVTIEKDGVEQDVYGDGIYREGEDWYVPGFQNLMEKESWEKADIRIIIAKDPVQYMGEDDAGNSWICNSFYDLNTRWTQQHKRYIQAIYFIIAGILCLCASRFFKDAKKQEDSVIAALSAKIWFEWKILATILVLLLVLRIQYDFPGLVELPVIFWLCYFCINDAKYNKKIWQNGFFGKLLAQAETKNMSLPFAKRLVRALYGIIGITVFGLAVTCVMLVLLLIVNYRLANFIYWLLLLTGFAGVFCILLGMEYFYQKRNRNLARSLEQLSKRITEISSGHYEPADMVKAEDSDIRAMEEVLEQIGQGMETAIEERIKSERMKVELVANVSHDIKTPLTSIISYIELLKQEENLSPEIQDYIRILEEKSERLKNMVQDVFSVSKAASGQLAVEMEEIDFGKLLRQTLADMDGEIQKSPYKFKIDIPKEAVMVYADGDRMYRVFQNLIGNALKYSLEGSRIYISLKTEKNAAVADIRNTSRSELKQDVDFTARFTRGDESRTDGGSGLGLSIAKSFTEACGGTFEVETMADLFTVKVSFEQKKCNV